MDLGLSGKVALVTGRAIALTLAKEGCDIACVDIDLPGVEDAAGQIRDMGRRAIASRVDQAEYEQVKQAVLTINQELGPVDILINDAAWIQNTALVKNMGISAWDKELQINLSGPFYFIKELLPGMVERGWGRILNVSSLAGVTGGYGQVGYSSTKAGLVGLTKTVAAEAAKGAVTANVLHLGLIDTAGSRGMLREDIFERYKSRIALRRPGTAEEVANMAVFLVSEKASFVTGAEIIIDGGLMCGMA
jgi:NAD(P)-dependent dehydrogenase (short-subunit alcohol dehydrogenase family)